MQYVACNLLPHGYWFYVTGRVPRNKDPQLIDAKLIEKYKANSSPSERHRRKRAGLANICYLRLDRLFVLLATHGQHTFFEEERASIRDARRVPLRVGDYSISYRRGGRTREKAPDRKWHSHVAINRRRVVELKAHFGELALRLSAERLALEFYWLPYAPYAPVRRQLLGILKEVNRIRKRAGRLALPYEVLPLRRRPVRPFELPSHCVNPAAGSDEQQHKPDVPVSAAVAEGRLGKRSFLKF